MSSIFMRTMLFVTGLALSSIAAFYSVTGLAYIFVSVFWPIVIMGGTLEVAKLVGASWVFRYWRTSPKPLVAYVSVGVFVLIVLTGIGIFGYLSRAYLTQQAPLEQLLAERSAAERDVELANAVYTRRVAAITNLTSSDLADQVIEGLVENDRLTSINGAVNVLREQQVLEQELQTQLNISGEALKVAERELLAVNQRTQEQSVDVGPLMFVAQAWYGSTEIDILDHVVTVFILIIISVFDPMAIALLLASQSVPSKRITPVNVPITPSNEPNIIPDIIPDITLDIAPDNIVAYEGLFRGTQFEEAPQVKKTVKKAVKKTAKKAVKKTAKKSNIITPDKPLNILKAQAWVDTALDTETLAEPSLENTTLDAIRPKPLRLSRRGRRRDRSAE